MTPSAPIRKPEEDYITITDLLRLCLANFLWFVLALALSLAAAKYYLDHTPNQYTREAAVMVNQEAPGKNTANIDGNNFNSIGLVQQPTNLNNVQRHLSSLDVLMEVANRLKLAPRDSVLQKAQAMRKQLKVELEDEKSTIINLKYTDLSPRQADKILYTLVQVYNEKTDQKKKLVNQNTSSFIDQRLQLLQSELDGIDDSISTFKSNNLITSLDRVSDIYLARQDHTEAQILTLSNQKAVAQFISDALKAEGAERKCLPANAGIGNSVIENQIAQYNNLLLQLNSHLAYTSNENPIIVEFEEQLTELRTNILKEVEAQIEALNIQLSKFQNYNVDAESKIASNPKQAKKIAAVERQQKVKESIYLYLLQKKEENEMNMSYTSQPTELIDVPHGSDQPSTPNRRNVLLGAIVLGIVVPVIFLFIIENMRAPENRYSARRQRRKAAKAAKKAKKAAQKKGKKPARTTSAPVTEIPDVEIPEDREPDDNTPEEY